MPLLKHETRGFMEHADWSPDMSTVVMGGEQVIAAAMAFDFSNGGWIRELGVRRPWQKRVSDSPYCTASLVEFYSRGVRIVGLGVDAESLTGRQHRLYSTLG